MLQPSSRKKRMRYSRIYKRPAYLPKLGFLYGRNGGMRKIPTAPATGVIDEAGVLDLGLIKVDENNRAASFNWVCLPAI